MDIMQLLVTLAIFGVMLYILGLIEMDATVKLIIRAIAILVLIIWVLQGFGIFHAGYIGPHR